MSERFTSDGLPIAPAQVWSGLTTESRACVIELLAHLASNLLTHQLVPTSAEDSPWRHDPTPPRSDPTTATASP